MTRDDTKKILTVMLITWPNFKPELTSEFVDIWHVMIGDLDYQQAQAALKAYAQTDTSGFAPSVGQLRAKVVELTTAAEMFEGEAWTLVRRAIGRSAYYSAEEFKKLPKIVQEAVGGPETLKSWAAMEEADLDYARGDFQRRFSAAKARQKERMQLSDDLKDILDRRPKIQDTKEQAKKLPERKTTEEERIRAAERAKNLIGVKHE